MAISIFDMNTYPIEGRKILTQFGTNVVHQDLDFKLEPREIVGLVGGSGSGKSVLLNTLLGLKNPEAGDILYFGQNRAKLSKNEREYINNQMGVLFQGGALFSSLTVRENIMVPLREHTDLSEPLMRELADMKIHMVGLPPHSATLFPSDLSGGMKKRAGLARALALDPKLLFLDEPTAGLDPIGASAFDELILNLKEAMNLTVLMVTHDLDSLFRICDRVAVLVDKKIAIIDALPKVVEYEHPWIQEYFGGPRARAAQNAGDNPEDDTDRMGLQEAIELIEAIKLIEAIGLAEAIGISGADFGLDLAPDLGADDAGANAGTQSAPGNKG